MRVQKGAKNKPATIKGKHFSNIHAMLILKQFFFLLHPGECVHMFVKGTFCAILYDVWSSWKEKCYLERKSSLMALEQALIYEPQALVTRHTFTSGKTISNQKWNWCRTISHSFTVDDSTSAGCRAYLKRHFWICNGGCVTLSGSRVECESGEKKPCECDCRINRNNSFLIHSKMSNLLREGSWMLERNSLLHVPNTNLQPCKQQHQNCSGIFTSNAKSLSHRIFKRLRKQNAFCWNAPNE